MFYKTFGIENVSGSDSIVEINTKGYGDNPIVIQSATAGAAVTARGVYADLLEWGAGRGCWEGFYLYLVIVC